MNLQNIPTRVYVFALILLCFITRLPQLLSPDLLLDGDECILGLMTKHLSQGKEIPVYFYGQSYGFSLLEEAFGAIGFIIFGVNAIALRCSLLLLWSVGIVFFFLSFLQLTNKKNAIIITLLLLLIPAWAIGSMKARGGYITAFTLTNIIIYCLLKAKESPSLILSIVIGIITYFIYISRPFWIPGLLPVFFYIYLWKKNFVGLLMLIAGGFITFIIIKYTIPNNYVYWEPKLLLERNYFDAIKDIPSRIYYNVTGSYCLEQNIGLGFFDRITSYIWDVILILLFLVQGYRIIKARYNALSSIFCLSIILTLFYLPFFTNKYGARYLLPYSQLLILWLGVEIIDFIKEKRFRIMIYYFSIALYIFCCGALIEFKDFNFMPTVKENISEQKSMDALVSYLKENGVNSAFAIDGMFQWMFTFYSNEGIICRWKSDKDRYPIYPEMVDKAIKESKPVALIWSNEKFYKLAKNPAIAKNVVVIGDRYYVVLNPTKDFLKSLDFQIND